MSGTIRRKKTAKVRLDQIIRRTLAFDDLEPCTRRTFAHLLYLVRSRTDLLRPTGAVDRYADVGLVMIVSGLLALARHDRDWLRPADEWEPAAGGAWTRFASLAQHLLARYPMPPFMASVWYRGSDDERRRQGWYKHMGLGRNIRTADVPLALTKRMAHEFAMAPDHYSVDMALRWGQVRGLGGEKALARAIVVTRLGRSFEHEDFWRTVVHFFVNHPELGLEHVGPIVDYLHNQRFVAQEVFAEEEEVSPDPPQPNLSMKGRTPGSLLRQMGEWHAWLRQRQRVRAFRWGPSGIGEFHLVESQEGRPGSRCWTIRELLTSGALHREGVAMRHCVATFARACARRESSIWSMRLEVPGRCDSILTIEVDPRTRAIRQARRHHDALPTETQRRILGLWARQAGLTIEC
jgi:PcfJ-like protein